MKDDNRAVLARLIQEEMDDSGRGPIAVTQGWSTGQVRAFYGWRDGSTIPLRRSRGMLEDALGWRRGVVTEVLEAPITQAFTLSEVRDWAAQSEPAVLRARDLSTDELLLELTRRVGQLQEEVDKLRGSNGGQLHTVSQSDRSHYDLAASDDHVPGEDDRD